MPIYQKGTSSSTKIGDMYLKQTSDWKRICKVYLCTAANTFVLVYDGCAVACDCDACEPCDYNCVYQDEEVTGTFNCGCDGVNPTPIYVGTFSPGCWKNTNPTCSGGPFTGTCYEKCCEKEPTNCPSWPPLPGEACCPSQNPTLECP